MFCPFVCEDFPWFEIRNWLVVYALLSFLPFVIDLLECFEFLLSVKLSSFFKFLLVEEFDVDIIRFFKGGFRLGEIWVIGVFRGNGFVLENTEVWD